MEAIILAGGLGTRLASVVSDVPKCMAPIHGRPFLEYQMQYWIGQGVGRFILSVGYMREIIQSHFRNSYEGIPVAYAVEETPLGTGAGLLLANRETSERGGFIVLNGDTLFRVPLKEMLSFHRDRGAALTMAVVEVQQNDRYSGIRLQQDGQIVDFRSARGGGGSTLINGGVYLLEPEVVSSMDWDGRTKVSLEDELFPALLRTGCRCYGYVSAASFIDIGVPESYQMAQSVIS